MFPSKVVNIKKSILWTLPEIVEVLKKNNNLLEVYHELEKKLNDINEFMLSIDILYILDRIEINDEMGNYTYVERN